MVMFQLFMSMERCPGSGNPEYKWFRHPVCLNKKDLPCETVTDELPQGVFTVTKSIGRGGGRGWGKESKYYDSQSQA